MHYVYKDGLTNEKQTKDTASAAKGQTGEKDGQGGPTWQEPTAPILIPRFSSIEIVFFNGERRRVVDVSFPALMPNGDFANQSARLFKSRKGGSSAGSFDSGESEAESESPAK